MSIEIITGPMFSSKSSTLLGRLGCDAAIGRKVLYINHSFDANRNNLLGTSAQEGRDPSGAESPIQAFSTHNPLYKSSQLSIINNFKSMYASDLPSYSSLSEYHTIGIDEAQFFDNLDEVINYAERNGSRVIVSGLIGNSNRGTFGNMLSLVPKADKFELLHAYCTKCAECGVEGGNPPLKTFAYFTHRFSPFKGEGFSKSENDENIIDVGSADKYIPVCRKHYLELNSI